MAKTELFMVCNSLGNVPGPDQQFVPQLTAPLMAIRPQAIPTNYSFGISIGIRDIDVHAHNTIQIILYAPDGAVVQDLGILNMEGTDSADTLPKELQGVILNADIRNVYLKMEGVYKIRVLFNAEILSEHSLPIYKGVIRP